MCAFDTELSKSKKTGITYTENEIFGQPALWLKIYWQIAMDRARIATYLNNSIPQVDKIILTGAGTSAFIGLSLHGAYSRNLKIHTDAVATTDLVSHPDDYFFSNETILLVSFARSGNSPESTAAVTLADKLCKKCYHLIITCDAAGQLARWNSKSEKLILVLPPESNDKSLAMTGSYSGMLLCGYLIANLKEIDKLGPQIDILHNYGIKILEKYSSRLEEIASLDFSRAIFLGSGPFYGTATESQLKVQELTDGNIVCKNDSFLGFRHGPKAVTNERTLMAFIFSNNQYAQQYEKDLVVSMKKGKKPLFTIGIYETPVDGLKFDLGIRLSESGNHLSEELLCVCAVLPGQLLGLYKSLALGLMPDAPSKSGAISRVVEDVTIYHYLSVLMLFCFSLFTTHVTAQNADKLLLKNYRPVSLYKIPVTRVDKAAFPVIDVHSHDFVKTDEDVAQWVKTMDACGIEKTVILAMTAGAKFDSMVHKYEKYGNRFEMWCGFDYTGYDKPGFGPAAVKELERCHRMGAKGVGELGDKGLGEFYSEPVPAWGMHYDDPRMKPLYAKCAELHMPVNIHVADPIWMYEKLDSTNDGLMNAQDWKVDMTKPGIIGFDALIQTLENTLRDNPKTTFIACHFANLNHDMDKLAYLLDKYPNFYCDIAARYAESATIPRYMKAFYEKYQDRLMYGTDMGEKESMYRTTFRILESNDEHFYEIGLFGYHWALNGFGLSKEILQKIYHDNFVRITR